MAKHIHALGPDFYEHTHRGHYGNAQGWESGHYPDHHHDPKEYQKMRPLLRRDSASLEKGRE